MNLAVGARTDIGQVREGNEDSFLADSPLFVVADGMGGHVAGDVASATAIEVVQRERSQLDASNPDSLARVVQDANVAIFEKASGDNALRGMGTTCTLLLVDGSTAHLAHVGDSRAYLLRDGELTQVTEDHTLVGRMVAEGRLSPEEAQHHPQRSMITRALGVDDKVEVDQFTLELVEGDILMLCSDGLSSMLSTDEMLDVLASDGDVQHKADRLVELANEAGGDDNITVVLVEAGGEGGTRSVPASHTADLGPRSNTDPAADTGYHRALEVAPPRRRGRRIALVLVILAALVGGGFLAAQWALANSWYVGVDDAGNIAVYQGVPDEVAGIELGHVHETSDVSLQELPEFKREDVEAGIKVDSLTEAEETVTALEELAEQTRAARPRAPEGSP